MSLSPDGDARQFRVSGDLKISKVIVQTPTWPTADAVATQDERKDVIKKFESQLMSAIKPTSSNEGQTITVRSVIADGRTVSSGLNVLTTAFLFVPVDRGGAVIEMEATDQSGKIVAAMMYRYSGEIGEFSSNFSKTAQIQIATQRASDRFAKLLFGQ